MKPSVVVYGPKGCGKTFHREQLRRHFGLTRIIDEGLDLNYFLADGPALLPNGVLYLAVFAPPDKVLNGAVLLRYKDAARMAGLPTPDTADRT